MIKIKKEVIEGIILHGKEDIPIEACGYLAGTEGIITRYYKLKNIDQSHEHFAFEPKEQFDTVRKARSEGLEICGNYHSHPNTPARPSAEDIKLAYDPDILYFIVSLADGEDLKAFRIVNSIVESQDLEIVG